MKHSVQLEEGSWVCTRVLSQFQAVSLSCVLVDGVAGSHQAVQLVGPEGAQGLKMGMEAGKGSQLHAKNSLHEVAKGDVVRQPDGVAHLLEARDKLLLGFKALEGSPRDANTSASSSECESNWTWR